MSTATDEARSPELRQKAEGIREDLHRLIREIEKVIVGHREVIEGILISLVCGGHVLLRGCSQALSLASVHTLLRRPRTGRSRRCAA